MKLKNFGVRGTSNVAIFKVVTIGGDEGWSGKKRKKDNNKKTKTKTLILRRRVELRGRGVSRECRRPAQASVQAAVPCKPESAHRVERREPKHGPGSFARSVSTVPERQ